MKPRLSLLLAVFSLCCSSFVTAVAQVDAGDSLALVNLYNSTDGDNWTDHTNWLTEQPVSNWYGIVTAKGRVTEIRLPQNHLAGSLSFSLYSLAHLAHLDLSQNEMLSIKLTTAIGKWQHLRELNLLRTATSGRLPKAIAKLRKLNYLNISYCNVTSRLPTTIGALSKLQTLALSHNTIRGRIPPSLVGLKNLTTLDLSNNQLSGELPSRGSFQNLASLTLNNNELTGRLPGWLVESAALTSLNVANNEFTGHIPKELDNANKLFDVNMSRNHFTGPIPDWLLGKAFLRNLYLDHNNLSQADNPCIHLAQTVAEIDFSHNNYNFNGLECVKEDKFDYIISPQAQITIHQHDNSLSTTAGGTLSSLTFKWYRAGSTDSVVIAGDSTFVPLVSGSYYAKVTDKKINTLTLYTDTFAYIKEGIVQTLNLSVYPNPVVSMLNVRGLDASTDAAISVADMTGYVWITSSSHQQSLVKLDVSRLKNGHYFVNVKTGKKIETVAFVKQ